MILSISYVFLAGILVAWQLWPKAKLSNYLGMLSLLLLVTFTLSFFMSNFNSADQLGFFAILLIGISIFGFIASVIRPLNWLKFPFLFVIIYLSWKMVSAQNFPLHQFNNIWEKGELLVELKQDGIPAFLAYAQNNSKIEVIENFDPQNDELSSVDEIFLIDLLDESPKKQLQTIEELKRRPEVEFIEWNERIELEPVEIKRKNSKKSSKFLYQDPLNSQQWALENTGMNDLYRLLKNNKPVRKTKLFILDTGIDGKHEDLKDVINRVDNKIPIDKRGHGTHCAGIAAAVTGNYVGISSFNANSNIEISSIQVLSDYGSGTQNGIIKGILKAADLGADVISLSLGGRSNDKRQRAYNEAIRYANAKGAIVVVAAGNSASNAKNYSPANSQGVITVAATNAMDQLAAFSNSIEDIELGISAPGVNILSCLPGDEYKEMSGTSMATPFVAGLVSCLKSYKPELNTKEVYELMESSGYNTHSQVAKKRIQPSAALERLLNEIN